MHAQGLGLISMRERVGLVKGTIRVTSTPGGGTEISVRVPLEAGQRGRDSRVGATSHVYSIPSGRAN
jgi:signal transduction histidine kinase